MMEVTRNLVEVLNNFKEINSSLVFEEGSTLKTVSEAKNILAVFNSDNAFPETFGVYNLKEFINIFYLVYDESGYPNISFNKTHLTVHGKSGRAECNYFYTDTEMLTKAPEKFNMPDAEVEFELSAADLDTILKARRMLGHEDLSIKSSHGCVRLSVTDPENASSNDFHLDVPAEFDEGVNFEFFCKLSNLKMLVASYKVRISSKLISEFTWTGWQGAQDSREPLDLKYYIALEKKSTYGE